MAFDRHGRHAQYFRRLFHGEAAEIAQFNNTAFLLVYLGELMKRLIQRDKFGAALHGPVDILVQREFLKIRATLSSPVRARVVNQDTAHHLRRDAEEMGAVLPVDPRLIDQPQVSLVHQGSGLQRVIGAFAAQVVGGKAAQLIVDERQQGVNGFAVAAVSGSINSRVTFSVCGSSRGRIPALENPWIDSKYKQNPPPKLNPHARRLTCLPPDLFGHRRRVQFRAAPLSVKGDPKSQNFSR